MGVDGCGFKGFQRIPFCDVFLSGFCCFGWVWVGVAGGGCMWPGVAGCE